jgi:hypothetical protein
MERAYDNMPPSKRPVKDVYVEEDHSSAKLVVEHFDQIKYVHYYERMRNILISELILFTQLTEC